MNALTTLDTASLCAIVALVLGIFISGIVLAVWMFADVAAAPKQPVLDRRLSATKRRSGADHVYGVTYRAILDGQLAETAALAVESRDGEPPLPVFVKATKELQMATSQVAA